VRKSVLFPKLAIHEIVRTQTTNRKWIIIRKPMTAFSGLKRPGVCCHGSFDDILLKSMRYKQQKYQS